MYVVFKLHRCQYLLIQTERNTFLDGTSYLISHRQMQNQISLY